MRTGSTHVPGGVFHSHTYKPGDEWTSWVRASQFAEPHRHRVMDGNLHTSSELSGDEMHSHVQHDPDSVFLRSVSGE